MSPEQLLAKLFRQEVLPEKIPIDVEKICFYYGISIEYQNYQDDTIGQIEFPLNNGPARIIINPSENNNINRRRFTIAHELGHFFLHKDKQPDGFIDTARTMSRTASYWDKIESEANDFAARLLMPQDFIISEGGGIIENYKNIYNANFIPKDYFVSAMAQKFNVSVQAMTYRLKNLNIIN